MNLEELRDLGFDHLFPVHRRTGSTCYRLTLALRTNCRWTACHHLPSLLIFRWLDIPPLKSWAFLGAGVRITEELDAARRGADDPPLMSDADALDASRSHEDLIEATADGQIDR